MKFTNHNANWAEGQVRVSNPWKFGGGPSCQSRPAAVFFWAIYGLLGGRLFYRLASPIRRFTWELNWFFNSKKLISRRSQNSSFHCLDASLYGYVNRESGAVTFNGRVFGLSPVNLARIIRGLEELPPEGKTWFNSMLREERAKTQLS